MSGTQVAFSRRASNSSRFSGKIAATFLFLAMLAIARAATPPLIFSAREPVTTAPDGGLRPVVGVQNIQVYRANRTHSEHGDGLDHTYTHQPMLAWWRGRFYLEYLSATRNEHDQGTVNSLTTSADGVHWTAPRIVFPAFALPDGSQTIAHQRMGFYVAPDGRLLILGFYGKEPAPNDGTGIGRAVREILEDGTWGPIYFIRMNAKQPFSNFAPPYPFFTTAPDRGFVEACQALLANKLMTAQWWEEDQLDTSDFYKIKGKALSFVQRPDGSVLGIWKNALVATTQDAGQTWTEKQFAANLPNNASKYWLWNTSDDRYALFFNPTNRLRHPLAVSTSKDAVEFTDLLAVHGELPDQRFGGNFKNMGPQYVRGIVEGNGTPPDAKSATWVTYSVNKEDIWISRVPVPITGDVPEGTISDDFEGDAAGALPTGWTCYSPLWAPVHVAEVKGPEGVTTHALELRDEEPCDYARAIRVFAPTHGLKISFRLLAKQTTGRLEIDLLDAHGARPVRLALAEDGHIWACHEGQWFDAGTYASNRWQSFELEIPTAVNADRCALKIDGRAPLARPAIFTDPVVSVERISFRTGAYRERGYGGRDLPGADEKVPATAFLIDNVVIAPVAASPR